MSHVNNAYRVPRRFDIVALLTVMTVYSLLFALLRRLSAPPEVFLVLGAAGFIISLMQIVVGADPRAVSVITGAILFPLCTLGWLLTLKAPMPTDLIAVVFTIPIGGVLGYVMGAFSAGIFMLLHLLGLAPGEDAVFRKPPAAQASAAPPVRRPPPQRPKSALTERLSLAGLEDTDEAVLAELLNSEEAVPLPDVIQE